MLQSSYCYFTLQFQQMGLLLSPVMFMPGSSMGFHLVPHAVYHLDGSARRDHLVVLNGMPQYVEDAQLHFSLTAELAWSVEVLNKCVEKVVKWMRVNIDKIEGFGQFF